MNIDDPSTPSLRDLIEEIVEERIATLNLPQIGSVMSYDQDTQTATVQPVINKVRFDEITGLKVSAPRSQISDVPMMFFGGASGRITTPVVPGDIVLLIHLGVHIDRWLLRGGVSIDPGFVDPAKQKGRISDVVALAGIYDVAHLPTPAPTDALVAHADAIKLGGVSATELVAWHSAMTQLKDVFNNWTPVTNDGGAALKALLTTLIATGWPLGSSKVRAE